MNEQEKFYFVKDGKKTSASLHRAIFELFCASRDYFLGRSKSNIDRTKGRAAIYDILKKGSWEFFTSSQLVWEICRQIENANKSRLTLSPDKFALRMQVDG